MDQKDKAYAEELLSHALNSQFDAAVSKTITSTVKTQGPSDDPIDEFLNSCGMSTLTIPSTVHSSHQRSPKEEVAFYSDQARGRQAFQDFWVTHEDDLPLMAALARSHNIRPVSSISSESLFSKAGYVQRKHRSSKHLTSASISTHHRIPLPLLSPLHRQCSPLADLDSIVISRTQATVSIEPDENHDDRAHAE